MKTRNGWNKRLQWLLLAGIMLDFLAANFVAHAQAPDPGGGISTYYGNPQDYWTFGDTKNWTSRLGYAPISFTNISASWLGDGTALVLDSSDPAWLQYNVTEASGTNNLKVDRGSVMLWFAPNWSSTNEGGTGPGGWGRLIEAGSLNSNGWWSLYLDPAGANIYFSARLMAVHPSPICPRRLAGRQTTGISSRSPTPPPIQSSIWMDG